MTAPDFKPSGGDDRDPVPDREAIAAFIHRLYHNAVHGLIQVDDCPQEKPKGEWRWRYFDPADVDQVGDWAYRASQLQKNTFVGIGLRREDVDQSRPGTNEDVISVVALKLDLDAQGAFEAALQALEAADLEPNLAVVTATVPWRRGHLYFILETPTEELARAKKLETILARSVNADLNVVDRRRVMRIGGTVNRPTSQKIEKHGRQDEVCSVHEYRKADYDLDELAAKITAIASEQNEPDCSDDRGGNTVGADQLTPSQSSKIAQKLSEVREGNWHNSIRDVTASLVSYGLDDASIIALLRKYTLPGWLPEQTESEIQKFIDSARSKWGHQAKAPDTEENKRPDIPAPKVWEWKDAREFDRFPWQYRLLFARGYVTITISQGGIGKSSLSLAEAISIATGRDLMALPGDEFAPSSEPQRVWYINLEDSDDLLDRRIAAIAKYYDLSREDLGSNLFINSGLGHEIILGTDHRRGAQLNEDAFEALKLHIIENDIDVLIIDPFVSSHRLNENDNGQIDMLAKRLSWLAQQCDIGIGLVHHTRKENGFQRDSESARGAKALTDAARIVRVLNPMSNKQAEDFGIQNDAWKSIFNASLGKANLSQIDPSGEWYQMVSVCLENGSKEGNIADIVDPGDTVGVSVRFALTPKEDAAASVSDDDLKAATGCLTADIYRENPQSPDWIGYTIAEALEIDASEGRLKSKKNNSDRQRIDRIIDALAGQGVIELTDATTKSGKTPPAWKVNKDRNAPQTEESECLTEPDIDIYHHHHEQGGEVVVEITPISHPPPPLSPLWGQGWWG